MSKEFLEHMWETFAREQNEKNCDIEGSGLGTSIAKSLVDLMGGQVSVKSEIDKGTIVTLIMPFAVAPYAEDKKEDTDDSLKLEGITILLVDDNKLNLETEKQLLEAEGAEVITSVNGVEAVEKFKNSQINSIDTIIMDISMPEMDGIEATVKIRSLSRPDAVAIPIIALTANAFGDDIQNSMMAGMNAHLTKPLEISAVVKTLLRCIRMQAVTQSKKLTDFMALANKDPLTGVSSRTAYEAATIILQDDVKNGIASDFGIVMFDVNNLKKTNDTIGHDAGDKLIINACKLICLCFKHSPVFRIGGDEFVIILQGQDFKKRESIIENFKQRMYESVITKNPVSVACGLAVYDSNIDKTFEDVTQRADKLMYENKAEMKASR